MTALTANVVRDLDRDVTLVRPSGVLDRQTADVLRAILDDVVAERPGAVIVDLGDCLVDALAAAAALSPVARPRPSAPAVALVVCGARPGLLTNVGPAALDPGPSYADVAGAFAAAAAALAGQPRCDFSAQRHVGAAARARSEITAACRQWQLDHLVPPATLVISELVTNAVLHADSEVRVQAILRGAFLHLRVHDSSRRPPLPGPPLAASGLRPNGRGMRLVELHCTGWGYVANEARAGKVVWATLHTRPGDPRSS